MSFFPTQAINELASEFKLLRKDIQAIRHSLTRLNSNTPKRTPRNNSDQPQNNQQLILIVATIAVVAFIMMQKDKPVSRNSEYDYY